ncbi:hypothetical protein HG537_0F04310 [Torulaspora globosa]|uniref:Fe2OG dioxygenase domain-containing protein n=1 Tax=Torulaspora globosa TaxID=48254 RepID=A0A7H9HWC1_9SACH|nr:hypothetical protein HG537_0F04310 [Torulaspora sp. CBS 2947]
MTEDKISTLIDLYEELIPRSTEVRSFLLEILAACDGSLEDASNMLNDTLGVIRHLPNKKHSIDQDQVGRRFHKVQRSLNYFIADEDKKIKPVGVDTRVKVSKNAIELHGQEDIEGNIKYLTFHEKVLPEDLANELLRQLLNDKEGFTQNEFHLFGNKCISNHTSKKFSSDPFILDGNASLQYNNRTGPINEYNDTLKIVQLLIEDVVNEAIQQFEPLPFQIRAPNWKGEVVLVNRYEKTEYLLWHSDRLTSLGPQAIVASLSLGCAREFRVRRNYPSDSQVYIIRPPHNSLIIMHAGFQEEYKHCIYHQTNNQATNLHPISKDVRFNLTYRNYLRKYMEDPPRCPRCDAAMDLRRSFKDPSYRGQYLWQCAGHYTGKDCKGMRLADFSSSSLTVDDKLGHGSRWLASDDIEAKKQQEQQELPEDLTLMDPEKFT